MRTQVLRGLRFFTKTFYKKRGIALPRKVDTLECKGNIKDESGDTKVTTGSSFLFLKYII